MKPTFHKVNLPYQIIPKEENQKDESDYYDVVGSTCMEKDVVMNHIKINNALVGDFIQIDNVGAYTIVKTPNFINYVPAIIAFNDDGSYKIIRHRQNIDDLLLNYVIE